MDISVEVEKPSSIVRKLTVRVPAEMVKKRLDREFALVQQKADLKGFRKGQAPLSVIKNYYGHDVRHQVFHHLIDESLDEAIRKENLRAVGHLNLDSVGDKPHNESEEHGLQEDQDLTFTASFEVMPEVKVKGYTGVSVTEEKYEVTEEQVEKVIQNLLNSHAQLVPTSGGLVLADGTDSGRPVQKGDFVDTGITGGLVTESGVVPHADIKGDRLIEVGAGGWIPGFEDQLIGMRRNESKTFRLPFPEDFSHPEMAGKEGEFTVTAHEVKEKKMPQLDDEFAKQVGYESLIELRKRVLEFLTAEKNQETQQKLKSDLLGALIEKNPFEVPHSLIESQTAILIDDWKQEFKKHRYSDEEINGALSQQLEFFKKRAEAQVRASLVLESIARDENIIVSKEDLDAEISKIASSANTEEAEVKDFYLKNPGRRADMEFRLRQDRTLKFLLDKAKIKSVVAKEK